MSYNSPIGSRLHPLVNTCQVNLLLLCAREKTAREAIRELLELVPSGLAPGETLIVRLLLLNLLLASGLSGSIDELLTFVNFSGLPAIADVPTSIFLPLTFNTESQVATTPELTATYRNTRPLRQKLRDTANVQNSGTATVPNPCVARMIAHVRRYLDRHFTISQLAAVAGVSSSTLRALFNAETGLPPSAFIKRMRMECARHVLIDRPEKSVKEVMALVGINDSSHFVRDFQRQFGLSPVRYRLKHKKAPSPKV